MYKCIKTITQHNMMMSSSLHNEDLAVSDHSLGHTWMMWILSSVRVLRMKTVSSNTMGSEDNEPVP